MFAKVRGGAAGLGAVGGTSFNVGFFFTNEFSSRMFFLVSSTRDCGGGLGAKSSELLTAPPASDAHRHWLKDNAH
jgi:hypothetical protein